MVLSIMNFVKLSLIMSCALWVHYPLLISSQLIFKASIMAAVDGNFFFFFWGGGGGGNMVEISCESSAGR